MSERDPGEPEITPDPTGSEGASSEPVDAPAEPTAAAAEPPATAAEPGASEGLAPGSEAQPVVSSSAEPPLDTTTVTPAAASGAGVGASGAGAASTPPTGGPPAAGTAAAGGGSSRTPLLLGLAVVILGLIAVYLLLNQGDGNGGATPTASASAEAAVSPSPEESPTEEPTEEPTPTATPDVCATENLPLKTAGQLTVGTDNPAFPPYFAIRDGGNTPPWEDLGFTGDPTTGEGFESAVAYAVAAALGIDAANVNWVVVPFANAIAPGPKDYDFVINQVSFSEERATAVDLSAGYYDLNQAVVALVDNPAASATSLAELKPYRFGAQVGTTSYDAIQEIIQPTQETQVYNDNTGAISALVADQIDAIVVDLPTADFIANAGVEIPSGESTIVGQFSGQTDGTEHFSLSLGLDSELTACVDQAIEALRAAGTLDDLASQWLPFQDGVPVLQ